MNEPELKERCFLCLKQLEVKKKKAKLREKLTDSNDAPTIQSVIKNFTKIELINDDNDCIESTICEPCHVQLKLIYEFTILCNKAQKSLLLLSIDIKDEKEEYEQVNFDDRLDFSASDDEPLNIVVKPELITVSPPPPDELRCGKCNHAFSSKSKLTVHLQTIHEEKINNAGKQAEEKRLSSEKKSKPPNKSVDNFAPDEYECNECGTKLKSKKRLCEHMRYKHILVESKCPICSKLLSTHGKLVDHMRSHGNKNHKCQYCGKEFVSSYNFKMHVRIHTSEKPHLCPICGKAFRTEPCIKSHLSRMHSDAKKPRRNHAPHQNNPNNKYKCDVCGRSFKLPAGLEKHYSIHNNTADRKFHCNLCNSHFKRADHLENHTNSVHLKRKLYACSLCFLSFATPTLLKSHSISHSEETPYHCQYCDKSYKVKAQLTRHLISHTGEKTLECSICKERFMTYKILYKHIEVCDPNPVTN